MPRASANGIELEYETFGDPKARPLLLIAGLGSQMISWDDSFCSQLAGRGFQVIRFDNRDAGFSTHLEEAGPADLAAALSGKPKPAYELDDLAADAAGLLGFLGIGAAHIVGVSMGGYIAQLVAINHPDRVLSLISIMSGPGWPEAVHATPQAAALLIVPPAPTREARIEQAISSRRVLVGPGDPFDLAFERMRAGRAFDRMYYPVGTGRQLLAVIASHGRLEQLKQVQVPTVVVHGTADPLIPVENGRVVASAIPGARLIEIEGMGHDLPKRAWPQVFDAIDEVALQATPLRHG
ncbi:MAG: alpha/beta fold hydrolase [Candidatus Dormibacteraceae bacterium]